jgi:hypothetical protein
MLNLVLKYWFGEKFVYAPRSMNKRMLLALWLMGWFSATSRVAVK